MASPLPAPTPPPLAQLTPHRAVPVRLPSAHGTLAALAVTPRAAAATVVLVPGYTGSKEDFAPLLDPLADAGLAAVALDLPGQYESDGPDQESEYLPARLGQVLAGVLAGLAPQPVLLVGHSFGGLVARSAVLAGAEPAGLVLLCTGPAELPAGRRRDLLEAAEPVLRAHGVEVVQSLRESVDTSWQDTRHSPRLQQLLRERFVRTSAAAFLGMGAGLRGEPDRVAELAAALRRRDTPCLVVCGRDDDAWPPSVQREMALRVGAPFVVVPGAAHSPAVENPAALLATLLPTFRDWLGR